MPKPKPVVELEGATDLQSADGLRQHTKDITDRLNELIRMQAVGRVITEDEWGTLEAGIQKLAQRTQSLDDILKAQAALHPGGSDGLTLDRAALRLDMPEGMHGRQRDYFNIAVLRWDEIAGLSHIGAEQARGLGVTQRVQRMGGNTNSDQLHDLVTRFQNLNDELLVLDTIMSPGDSRKPDLNARYARMRNYKRWPEYTRLVNQLCDAMKVERSFNEGTSTSGLNWVPVILSAQLMDLVQVWGKVAPLFTPVTMTSKTLDWPVLGGDLSAFIMAEAVLDGTDTAINASTAVTNKVTFSAIKMGVRTFASSELIEDSIIPMIPFIIGNAAKVLARGIEDAIINGEFNAATMDGTTFNPAAPNNGPRRAWDGLRKHSLTTASYPAKIDMAAATITEARMLDLQFNMGAWGASPAPLAWITGFHGLKSIMKLQSVLTLEKFGPAATILSGQVANIFGSPVILTEFVTEKDATGVHNATPANNVKGSVLCAHRESYGLATRRGISVNGSQDRYIEVDQTVFVATARNDFKAFYTPSATVTPVGIIYNIL